LGYNVGASPPCEYMCVRSLGYLVGASPPVKMCVSVRWGKLWVRPPPLWKYVCPFVGLHCGCVPPPLWKYVCPLVGLHCGCVLPPLCVHSLDPCMLPTLLCGIFSWYPIDLKCVSIRYVKSCKNAIIFKENSWPVLAHWLAMNPNIENCPQLNPYYSENNLDKLQMSCAKLSANLYFSGFD